MQVPPCGFQEVAGHSKEPSEEGVPQWRCCFETECEACFGSFVALATHVLRHHRHMETVSGLAVTNECLHRHLLSSILRGFCRGRSRYLGLVHKPLCLCCPVCTAEPGNWSELQQRSAEHLCDVFKNGFGDASVEQAQVRNGRLAGAGPAGGAPGGGRGRQRWRGSSATGRGAGHSVVSQRGRAEGIDRHRLQNLSCPLLGARGRGRSVPPRSGRHQGQA